MIGVQMLADLQDALATNFLSAHICALLHTLEKKAFS